MDLVEYVKQNTDPLKILNHYNFREISENEYSLRACCEIHGGDNNTGFIWNKENDLWFCYTGECGGGDVFDLIQKIEGIDFKEAVKKAALILGLEAGDMQIKNKRDDVLREQLRWIESQKKRFINKNNNQGGKTPSINISKSAYLPQSILDRFSEDTVNFYKGEFAQELTITEESGKTTKLYNKLLIPIYDKDERIGVALRDTTGNFNPKWLYQPRGLKLSETLYNYDIADKAIVENCMNEVILVEGIFDVWAYHEIGLDNVVAIFGSSLSDEQYKKILKLGVDVTLSFDNDNAGNKCKDKVLKLLKNKASINLINLPEGRDPDDISRSDLKSCYLSRNIYTF